MVASLLFGLMSTGALGGLFVAYLADYFYKRRPEYRGIIAAISSIVESILFIAFFSAPLVLNLYKNNLGEAVETLLSLIVTSSSFLFWFSLFFTAMFFNSSVGPIKNSVLSDSNLPEHRATVFAGITIIEWFCKALGITLVGLLSDYFGGLRLPIVLSMGLWVVSGLAWLGVTRYYPDDMKRVDLELIKRREVLLKKAPLH